MAYLTKSIRLELQGDWLDLWRRQVAQGLTKRQ